MGIRKRVKILPSGKTKILWEADLGIINGKRIAFCFPTKEEARTHLNFEQDRIRSYGQKSYTFTPKEIQLYGIALEKLQDAGLTFDEAIDIAIRIKSRLSKVGVAFDEVFEFWENYHRPSVKSITIRAALPLFYAEKERLEIRDRSLSSLRSSLKFFAAGREDRSLESITLDEVTMLLSSNGLKPKTQRNYLGDICNLMNWAVAESYLHKNIFMRDPETKKYPIKLPPIKNDEITSLGPEVCERMLYVALNTCAKMKNRNTGLYEQGLKYRQLLGYLILAMFCGIRPEELRRTARKNISLENHTVVVRGMDSKTKNRRVIELSENAEQWLALWLGLCPDGLKIIPKNFDRLWKEFKRIAGVSPWPHDILRHTCASMHYACHQNLASVKALLGHVQDEDTFERHYHSVQTIDGETVSKAMATKFWNIFPPPRIPSITT